MYTHAPAGTLDELHPPRPAQFETELFQRVRRLPGASCRSPRDGGGDGRIRVERQLVLEGTGTMQHHAPGAPPCGGSLSSPTISPPWAIPGLRGSDFADANRYGSSPIDNHQRSARATEFSERGIRSAVDCNAASTPRPCNG